MWMKLEWNTRKEKFVTKIHLQIHNPPFISDFFFYVF